MENNTNTTEIKAKKEVIMADCKKILVVDDEAGIRKSLTRNLERQFKMTGQKYEIREAVNGLECIQLAKKDRPDLILLDIRMPVMDGMQACSILRNDPKFDPTVIIILTAEATAEVKGLSTGADDYVTKPYDIHALLVRVEKGLKTAQQRGFIIQDSETNLWTKGYFENCRIHGELGRAKRHGRDLCLLIIQINATTECDIESDVIADFISSLSARSHDITVRWRHNAFALLLPETNGESAIIVAERLKERFAGLQPQFKLSIGIGYFDPFSNFPCAALVAFAETSMAVSYDCDDIVLNGEAINSSIAAEKIDRD